MIILGTNSIKDTGFDVDNSLRINQGDSSYLKKTFGTATNRRKFTYSFWCKKQHNTDMGILSTGADANNRGIMYFNDSGDFNFLEVTSGSVTSFVATNRLFRDSSAWYHFVIAVDTTQGTNTNRVKIYVNGIQETSLAQTTYMNQNYDGNFNASARHDISSANGYGEDGYYWNGYLAEVVFIDGQQLAPTSFGEFDEDSGIWKPIDVSGLTFGTNGFYLDFEDSANLGNDANGGTDLTEVNLAATDQSTDTCTTNFCLINPLDKYIGGTLATYSEGNTRFSSSGNSSSNNGTRCNFAVANGKWYWEVKLIQNAFRFGIQDVDAAIQYSSGSNFNIVGTYAVQNNGAKSINNTESASAVTTFSNGDTAMMAMDLENQKLYFGVNGTWSNSGNPESGSSGTGSIGDLVAGTTYIPVFSNGAWAQNTIADFNFGNPAYSISSSNTDGDGYGNFEYAVPSGYFSLNTKNLAEYG